MNSNLRNVDERKNDRGNREEAGAKEAILPQQTPGDAQNAWWSHPSFTVHISRVCVEYFAKRKIYRLKCGAVRAMVWEQWCDVVIVPYVPRTYVYVWRWMVPSCMLFMCIVCVHTHFTWDLKILILTWSNLDVLMIITDIIMMKCMHLVLTHSVTFVQSNVIKLSKCHFECHYRVNKHSPHTPDN